MSEHRVPTRAESRTFGLENLRERARLHAELGASWEEVKALLACLDKAERERDEAKRLLREVREIMWDEEPLCAEIHAFLKGDNRDRPAEDEAGPRLEQWS